jgi:hypothetical protein
MQTGPNGTNITLVPVRNGQTFVEWKMSQNGTTSGPGHYPQISVNGPSDLPITFTIQNPQSITFNTANPIFVQPGTGKPSSGVDPQFTYALSANPQGTANTVLTLNDTNQNTGPYNYVLKFVNAGDLDPIINNSGPHATTSFASDYAWYAVGAVAVVAIAVLALRAMRRRT